jgi:ribosomal protein S11
MMSGRARKEEILQIIHDDGGLSGISFTEDKVVFDGFPETTDTDAIRAWTLLSTAINKNAIKQIHVRVKEVDETNEKFAFRTWLTRLGMNGKDLRVERNILYRNLSGHTAFRTAKDEEKWKTTQAAKRAELKALKAAASAESEEGAAED